MNNLNLFPFNIDELKTEKKKDLILGILSLFLCSIVFILSIVLDTRENSTILFIVSTILIFLFSIISLYCLSIKFKTVNKLITFYNKGNNLIKKKLKFIKIKTDSFIRDYLEFSTLVFEEDKKEVELNILSKFKNEFSENEVIIGHLNCEFILNYEKVNVNENSK